MFSTFFAGVPKSELSGGIRSSSKLPLVWSAEDLRTHILKTFPRVINFRYMKCNQGKNLEPLPQEICPRDLRDLLGRSGLYIVPIAPLLPKVGQLPIVVDKIWTRNLDSFTFEMHVHIFLHKNTLLLPYRTQLFKAWLA